jgi:hypothetical protein
VELDKRQRVKSVLSTVQTLRSQIELYKLMHGDVPPDFRNYGWKQLTQRTDTSGAIIDACQHGPYLRSPPGNALTGRSTILVVRSVPKGFQYRQGDCGFVFDESSGNLFALDAEGRIFDENARSQVRVD